jgi:hypothetical protein
VAVNSVERLSVESGRRWGQWHFVVGTLNWLVSCKQQACIASLEFQL